MIDHAKEMRLEEDNARLRAEVDAKSAEIAELQEELHRVRPIADQVDDLHAELDRVRELFHNLMNNLPPSFYSKELAAAADEVTGYLYAEEARC